VSVHESYRSMPLSESRPQGGLRLPPGPDQGRLAQTVMLASDPLRLLRLLRSRFGPVFTVRSTNGPLVVIGSADALSTVTDLDPGGAHAGEARRRVLPQASPLSVFGGDGDAHRDASARVHDALTPAAISALEPGIAEIARRHAASWPARRPFQLRVALRDVADEVWVTLVLRPRDQTRSQALIRAARHLLRTPGNPPLPPPGETQGLLGPTMTRLLERRLAPFASLVRAEIADRRDGGGDGDGGLLERYAATDLDPQDVVDELTILTGAALEATASGLTSVLEQLAHHPELAARLADGGATDPLFEPIVDESLRLRPVAMAAMRRLTQPLELAGHDLQAGTVLMAPSLLLHRDPGQFADPDSFRMDRFAAGPHGPFFPFGGGERACIGRHLAQAEIRNVVPAVLSTRRLTPLAHTPERLVERATILAPCRGALMIAASRPS
jgi:cytochrome P450